MLGRSERQQLLAAVDTDGKGLIDFYEFEAVVAVADWFEQGEVVEDLDEDGGGWDEVDGRPLTPSRSWQLPPGLGSSMSLASLAAPNAPDTTTIPTPTRLT